MSIFGEHKSISRLKDKPLEYEHPHDVTTGEKLEPESDRHRLEPFFALIVLIFMVLIFRLFGLQVISGASNLKLAEGNRIRMRALPAPRGIIYDRSGKPIVKNIARYDLIVTPADLPKDKQQRESEYQQISTRLGIDLSEITKTIESKGLFSIDPIYLQNNIPAEQALVDQVKLQDILGFEISAEPIRSYPQGNGLSQVIGYIGKVAPDDINSNLGYQLTDWIGKTGLEKEYEQYIKGTHGQEQVEIDSKGRLQRIVAVQNSVQGDNLYISLDSNLQTTTYQSLQQAATQKGNGKGAALALNPNTGEIYALVSFPDYDQNQFINGNRDALNQLFNDPKQPLLNRAITGVYPSGSSIKPVYAAAALQEHVISQDTAIQTPDVITIGTSTFPDWKKHDGLTNVVRAIAESNNIFFYALAGGYDKIAGLGINRIDTYLKKFGFGSPTNIDLPNESSGFVPTPDWKKQKKHESWYIGDTYHLGIGQGDLGVTPLQLVVAESALINGGSIITPHLANKIVDINGQTVKTIDTQTRSQKIIDQNNLAVVQAGMRQTITSGSGHSTLGNLTGQDGQPIQSAGKTGTAQTGHGDTTHAWYVGYAPYDHPQIMVVVLVEEGGEGFSTAAPVAGDMFKAFFQK